MEHASSVIPAKAGIHAPNLGVSTQAANLALDPSTGAWIPAFAGMTSEAR